jgi:hypothetical protein
MLQISTHFAEKKSYGSIILVGFQLGDVKAMHVGPGSRKIHCGKIT